MSRTWPPLPVVVAGGAALFLIALALFGDRGDHALVCREGRLIPEGSSSLAELPPLPVATDACHEVRADSAAELAELWREQVPSAVDHALALGTTAEIRAAAAAIAVLERDGDPDRTLTALGERVPRLRVALATAEIQEVEATLARARTAIARLQAADGAAEARASLADRLDRALGGEPTTATAVVADERDL